MSTPRQRVAALAAVVAVTLAAASAGYYTTGLLYDSETATIRFTVDGAGNATAGNTATATAGNTATGTVHDGAIGGEGSAGTERVTPVGTDTGAAASAGSTRQGSGVNG